ncbi:hypothetical protein WDZ17_00290 [Pseudokineococcus basanitobsidens]|uniref:Secreted protein n=1 Tax=Pseudokineococcus basanitobsidens TaxID=1926649 RepID=A0ABU8RFB0_9ACTN
MRGRGGRPAAVAALPVLLLVAACSPPSATDLFPVLAEPQDAEDTLPTLEGELVPREVVADSARHLASTAQGDFWVAVGDLGAVCLVAAVEEATAVASACGAPTGPGDRPIVASVQAGDASATGLLVPEGDDLSHAPPGEEWVMVADNLAVPADEDV